jgi:DNA-binding MarR family transcriptional regulator
LQAVKPLLDHLEHCGYLKRVPDRDDHRAQRTHTTARGKHLMAAASAIITEIDQDIERQLGPRTHAPSCGRSSKNSRRSPPVSQA